MGGVGWLKTDKCGRPQKQKKEKTSIPTFSMTYFLRLSLKTSKLDSDRIKWLFGKAWRRYHLNGADTFVHRNQTLVQTPFVELDQNDNNGVDGKIK